MKNYPNVSEKEFMVKEIQLSYKKRKINPVKINSSATAASFLHQIWNKRLLGIQEEFVALFLDRGNNVVSYYVISKGGISGTVIDVRLILAIALKTFSSSIILAHNHPSGSLKFSDADLNITYKIKSSGLLMNVNVVDHLIITENGYYSMADAGFLNN